MDSSFRNAVQDLVCGAQNRVESEYHSHLKTLEAVKGDRELHRLLTVRLEAQKAIDTYVISRSEGSKDK